MSPELPSMIAKDISNFGGRTWLLPELLDWYRNGDERIMLLTGGPGTGKSMIMAWLAGFGPSPAEPEADALLTDLRKQVRAVHFCMAASRNNSPTAFAKNIANQLTANVPGFAEALSATFEKRMQINVTQRVRMAQNDVSITGVSIGTLDLGALDQEDSFDSAFSQPIKRLFGSGCDEPLLLLVDALDEAQTYTGSKTLVQLLSELRDLPPHVHILATTRSDPRVLKQFRGAKAFDLIKCAPPNVNDVRIYGQNRLGRVEGIDDDKASMIVNRIADTAKGTFLYAAIVLDDLLLNRPDLSDLDFEHYPLPDGLSGLYHDFLNRELGRDEDRWYERFKPVLSLISVAEGDGLTSTQLASISGKEVEQTLRICRQYLDGELPDGPFSVFHKSFADFLLEDDDNLDYHIDAAAMHRRIADHYWQPWSDSRSTPDEYGLACLVLHLLGAGQIARSRELITEAWMQVRGFDGARDDAALVWPNLDDRIEIFREKTKFEPAGTGAVDILGDLLVESYSLLIRRAYTEKTQAQAAIHLGDTDGCERHLVEAQNCFEEILEQFQGGLSSSPSTRHFLSGVYNGLASVYMLRNRLKDAIKYYVLATQTDPTNTFAFWDYSALLDFMSNHYGSGWCAEAIQITEQTIPLIANSPDFVDSDLEMVKDRLARLKGIDNKEPEGSIRVKIIPT